MGHVTEYAILATLLWYACGRRWGWVLLICITYASLDEWHQTFVPSRVGSVQDVMIDTLGAGLALLALKGTGAWITRRRARALHQA